MKSEVVILAGGFGTRLKGVIDNIPKPMAVIGDKPFLSHLMEQLFICECKKAILSVGHKHEVISDYFGGEYKSVKLEYVIEDKPLGTGGGILNASKLVTTPGFLVLNGDSYFDLDLSLFEQSSMGAGSPISVAVKRMKNFKRYGTIEIKNNRIRQFSEKKPCSDGLINSGIYYLNKEWYLQHAPGEVFSFEKDILEKYVNEEYFSGFEFKGYFIDIGIPEDYMRASKELKGKLLRP